MVLVEKYLSLADPRGGTDRLIQKDLHVEAVPFLRKNLMKKITPEPNLPDRAINPFEGEDCETEACNEVNPTTSQCSEAGRQVQ